MAARCRHQSAARPPSPRSVARAANRSTSDSCRRANSSRNSSMRRSNSAAPGTRNPSRKGPRYRAAARSSSPEAIASEYSRTSQVATSRFNRKSWTPTNNCSESRPVRSAYNACVSPRRALSSGASSQSSAWSRSRETPRSPACAMMARTASRRGCVVVAAGLRCSGRWTESPPNKQIRIITESYRTTDLWQSDHGHIFVTTHF